MEAMVAEMAAVQLRLQNMGQTVTNINGSNNTTVTNTTEGGPEKDIHASLQDMIWKIHFDPETISTMACNRHAVEALREVPPDAQVAPSRPGICCFTAPENAPPPRMAHQVQ